MLRLQPDAGTHAFAGTTRQQEKIPKTAVKKTVVTTKYGICRHFCFFSMENMWKRYFQNGGGIVLLLGALVKFQFGGLKFRQFRVSRISDFGAPVTPY